MKVITKRRFLITTFLGIITFCFLLYGGITSVPAQAATPVSQSGSAWTYLTFEDEFGDETPSDIVSGLFEGKLITPGSRYNTATLQILYNDGVPMFRIFDYGDEIVNKNNYIRFKIKDSEGEVYVMYMTGENGFYFPVDTYTTLKASDLESLLLKEKPLKLSGIMFEGNDATSCTKLELKYYNAEKGYEDACDYIDKLEATMPRYQFTVNPKGLNKMIKK